MNKLNAFAELIAEGKRQKLLEEAQKNGKHLKPPHTPITERFKLVENTSKPTQNVEPKAVDSTVTTNDEKRFERLLKQLQNDFATLKRHVDSIPRNTGYTNVTAGSGEVRIARMDDISKATPKDGDMLVWNAITSQFEYSPSVLSKAVPNNGDALVWNSVTGFFEPAPVITPVTDEEMPFAKRIDFVGSTIIYKGEAAVGSLETDPVWRVRKLILAPDDDVIEVWAEGVSTYTHTWSDRLTFTYS